MTQFKELGLLCVIISGAPRLLSTTHLPSHTSSSLCRHSSLPHSTPLHCTAHSTALAEAPDRRQICYAGAGLKCPATLNPIPTLARPLRLSQHRMRRRLTHRPSLTPPPPHTTQCGRGKRKGYHRHSSQQSKAQQHSIYNGGRHRSD